METNIKLIKEIGSGGNGTAYLAEYNNIKMIYKIEKMDIYNETQPLTSEYYRQIDFNEFIAKNNPNKFLLLKLHGIIYDCEYKHPLCDKPRKWDENRERRFIRKNSQPNCYYLLYYPLLDGDVKNIKDIIYNDHNLFIDFLYQIIDSINIMKKNGYTQNDMSQNNIMFKKINELKYQWYIIDYGNIYNNKYPISKLDEDIRNRANYSYDLFNFLLKNIIFTRSSINIFLQANNIEKPSDDITENYIKNHKKYKKIIKFMPKKEKNIEIIKNIIQYSPLILLTQLLYPCIILYSAGINKKLVKEFKNKQLFPKLIAYCIKYYNNDNYDKILNKIKKNKNKL